MRAFGVSRRAPPCYLPAMFPLPPLTDEQRAIIERAAALAREHDFVLASDEAYSEIYFGEPTRSALQVSSS